MQASITIPTKSYIKKYLEISFGSNIKLTERNWLGLIVLSVLKRKTFRNPNYDFKKYNYSYNTEMTFLIDVDRIYRNGSFILNAQKYYINKSIDQIFKDELVKQALINHKNFEIDFKTSILSILEAYDITEDELNYETLRKYFDRNKNRFENRMIF